jgi:hypothetical protein
MNFEINPVYNPVFHRICKRIAEEWVNSDEEPSRDSDSETEGLETDREQLIFSDEEDHLFREGVLKKPLLSFDGEFDLHREQLIFSDEEDHLFREGVLKKPLLSFDGEFDLHTADYSDLDSLEDKDFGNPLPTHRSRKSKRPSKANRAKPAEEVDDCRPHSEKNWFSLLKESKKSSNLLKSIL